MKKQSVISKSAKVQASKKSRDTSSSSNEVYSILENSLRRKADKQIVVLTSSRVGLTSKLKKKHTKIEKEKANKKSKAKNTQKPKNPSKEPIPKGSPIDP